ncbi:MAG TPA: hypothetical protein PKC98_19225, partial [Candidatus Melainabacteria bacterium]|nr:hypothetical protein [Candidatus Melainabacteria bacterium]
RTESGARTDVLARQKTTTTYNLWAGLDGETCSDWELEISLNGEKVAYYQSGWLSSNFWNNRTQLTFTVHGEGEVKLSLNAKDGTGRFDCWINHQDDAHFISHEDPHLISEPAIFPEVIAVGLKVGKYSPDQGEIDRKPEVLLDGGGPVSFRLPEVVLKIAAWLESDGTLDSDEVRKRLTS